jgi:hypothetical protein
MTADKPGATGDNDFHLILRRRFNPSILGKYLKVCYNIAQNVRECIVSKLRRLMPWRKFEKHRMNLKKKQILGTAGF